MKNISINTIGLIKSTFLLYLFQFYFGLFLKFIFKNWSQKYLKFFPFFSEIAIAFIIAVIFIINFEYVFKISYLVVVGVIIHNLLVYSFLFKSQNSLKYPTDVRKTFIHREASNAKLWSRA